MLNVARHAQALVRFSTGLSVNVTSFVFKFLHTKTCRRYDHE